MKLYMLPLMRSGTMWSCGRIERLPRFSRFWPLILHWMGLTRARRSARFPLRRLLKPEKPWY